MKTMLGIKMATRIGIVALTAALAGCYHLGERALSDNGATIPEAFTYDWLEQPQSSLAQMSTKQRSDLREGFDRAVISRGATQVAKNEAQYLVAVHYSPKADITMIDLIDSYGGAVKRSDFSDKKGLLIKPIGKQKLAIELIDAQSREVVWRGTTIGYANPFSMDKTAYGIAKGIPNDDCIYCINWREAL